MAINWGGGVTTLDIGVRNNTGATRQRGDVVAIDTVGAGADGFGASLPTVNAGHPAGLKAMIGVVLGVDGGKETFQDQQEMMIRVCGPAKARLDGTGITIDPQDLLEIAQGNDNFVVTDAAQPDMTAANDADTVRFLRGKAVYIGSGSIVTADSLVDVLMMGW